MAIIYHDLCRVLSRVEAGFSVAAYINGGTTGDLYLTLIGTQLVQGDSVTFSGFTGANAWTNSETGRTVTGASSATTLIVAVTKDQTISAGGTGTVTITRSAIGQKTHTFTTGPKVNATRLYTSGQTNGRAWIDNNTLLLGSVSGSEYVLHSVWPAYAANNNPVYATLGAGLWMKAAYW